MATGHPPAARQRQHAPGDPPFLLHAGAAAATTAETSSFSSKCLLALAKATAATLTRFGTAAQKTSVCMCRFFFNPLTLQGKARQDRSSQTWSASGRGRRLCVWENRAHWRLHTKLTKQASRAHQLRASSAACCHDCANISCANACNRSSHRERGRPCRRRPAAGFHLDTLPTQESGRKTTFRANRNYCLSPGLESV